MTAGNDDYEEIGRPPSLWIDPAEKAYIEARNSVSDAELLARVQKAPDCGGSLLVELSEFVEQHVEVRLPHRHVSVEPCQ